MTRAESRWGCFLPDLTRLASGTSITNLPEISYRVLAQEKQAEFQKKIHTGCIVNSHADDKFNT